MDINVFKQWRKEKKPPKWVLDVYEKWYDSQGVRPYNKVKYFKGKTFLYKFIHGMGRQGECPLISIEKRLRYKHRKSFIILGKRVYY